jgi:hypothetical protein
MPLLSQVVYQLHTTLMQSCLQDLGLILYAQLAYGRSFQTWQDLCGITEATSSKQECEYVTEEKFREPFPSHLRSQKALALQLVVYCKRRISSPTIRGEQAFREISTWRLCYLYAIVGVTRCGHRLSLNLS